MDPTLTREQILKQKNKEAMDNYWNARENINSIIKDDTDILDNWRWIPTNEVSNAQIEHFVEKSLLINNFASALFHHEQVQQRLLLKTPDDKTIYQAKYSDLIIQGLTYLTHLNDKK